MKAGVYDENIHRSQDMDLNSRLRLLGGKTLLVPSIRVKYFARASVSAYARKAISDGYWVTFPALSRGTRFAIRHFIPLIFLSSILVFALLAVLYGPARIFFLTAVALYLICAFGASILAWRSAGSPRLILVTAAAFVIKHLLYGCGSVLGIASWIVSIWPNRNLQLRF